MKLPLQIAARNTSLSKAAKEEIREKALKLDRHYGDIIRCRVTVDKPHRHHKKGEHYEVRIDLTLPGAMSVIRREPNSDLFVAIRDSFDAARRRLDDVVQRRRGKVKTHASDTEAESGPPLKYRTVNRGISDEAERKRDRAPKIPGKPDRSHGRVTDRTQT